MFKDKLWMYQVYLEIVWFHAAEKSFVGRKYCPYRKPTQVLEWRTLRWASELLLRNSAKWVRNFGRRTAGFIPAAANRPKQLFIKNTGFCKIPCRVSSDPHERRNDLGAVSTIDSVKFKFQWRCWVPATGRKDPVELYCSLILNVCAACAG